MICAVYLRFSKLKLSGPLNFWWCVGQIFEQLWQAITWSISIVLIGWSHNKWPTDDSILDLNLLKKVPGQHRSASLLKRLPCVSPPPFEQQLCARAPDCPAQFIVEWAAAHSLLVTTPHALTHPHSSETAGDGGEHRWGVSTGWCGGWVGNLCPWILVGVESYSANIS